VKNESHEPAQAVANGQWPMATALMTTVAIGDDYIPTLETAAIDRENIRF